MSIDPVNLQMRETKEVNSEQAKYINNYFMTVFSHRKKDEMVSISFRML